jgi:hypothetical protein
MLGCESMTESSNIQLAKQRTANSCFQTNTKEKVVVVCFEDNLRHWRGAIPSNVGSFNIQCASART